MTGSPHARLQPKALQLAGGRLAVRVSVGSPPVSPPVVLVHGIVSSRYLLPTASWLAQRRPVVAPDLLGFGASERPRYQPTIGELADVLRSTIDEVGLAKPVLVGHSIGVHVVAELALRHPEVVSGLVLAGPTGDPRLRTVRALWGRWMASAPSEPLAFNALVLREIAEIGPLRMVSAARRAVAHPLALKLPGLTPPVLVVRGERDRVTPDDWARQIADTVVDARLAVLPGVAHTIVYSAPDRLGALIDGFALTQAQNEPSSS